MWHLGTGLVVALAVLGELDDLGQLSQPTGLQDSRALAVVLKPRGTCSSLGRGTWDEMFLQDALGKTRVLSAHPSIP